MPGIDRWYRYVRPSLDTKQMQHYHELATSIFSKALPLIEHERPWNRTQIDSLRWQWLAAQYVRRTKSICL